MTAKEILSETIFTEEGFTNYELEQIIDVMEEYAKEKCQSNIDWERIELDFKNSEYGEMFDNTERIVEWFKNRIA